MCSKCHKDTVLKQQQGKLAASSIEDIVNSSSSTNKNEPFLAEAANAESEFKVVPPQPSSELATSHGSDVKTKEGPNRCATCRKRVGLTGFSCRCGHMFCSVHRYSDKHNCQFDYRIAGQDAIAKANPVVKAEKLDKI